MKEVDALFYGGHDPNGKMCFMEAAAYVAGLPWSDSPECVSPIIARFLRNWNDSLRTDEERTRLLAPLIPVVLGTAGSAESEMRRSWMAFDWLVRECGPAFMDLTDALKPHAKALRDLPPIYGKSSLDAAMSALKAAREASAASRAAALDAAGAAARTAARTAARAAARAAAMAAARDAAWDAAWYAAMAAARAAAGDAAWYAARDAARDAARAAARAAAMDAAWDAAWYAARAAAWAALAPSVQSLQQSAVELVKRMAEVERTDFAIQRSLKINGYTFEASV